MNDVSNRITAYLSLGGLFNPELADHAKVKELLIDARDALDAQAQLDASVRDAAWEDALEEAALIFLVDTGYGQITSQFIAAVLREMKGSK